MKKRCTPQLVEEIHRKNESWRKAAEVLNALYGVKLHHLTWRDYATGRRDIADLKTRSALMLDQRA